MEAVWTLPQASASTTPQAPGLTSLAFQDDVTLTGMGREEKHSKKQTFPEMSAQRRFKPPPKQFRIWPEGGASWAVRLQEETGRWVASRCVARLRDHVGRADRI
ncbi:hypothetical protein AGIG_G25140 [Arapaima gigas]